MFRRKTRSSQDEESKDSHHSSSPVPCSNCIKLMQEISQLREENNELKCDKQRKQYTIAPTLYTYYKSNVLKNRVSRCVVILFLIIVEPLARLHSRFWSQRKKKIKVHTMRRSSTFVLSHSLIRFLIVTTF